MIRMAVVGMGFRAVTMVRVIREVEPTVKLVAIVDPDPALVDQKMAAAKIDAGDARRFGDIDQLLEHADDFDAVLVGTRCHLHTPLAIKLAPLNKPTFLEKPVAISSAQLHDLAQAYRHRQDNVVVSFPLRVTPLLESVMDIIASGRLGILTQLRAVNCVSYGGIYFGQWYRNYEQTGGLWLQKATHDFDYINRMMGARPVAIAAMSSLSTYGGDQPHDLRCSACDRASSCPEGPDALRRRDDCGGMSKMTRALNQSWDHACAFSRDIQNQDSGSAIIRYDNGTHASYAQNFVARRSAGRRGATIIGYDATLDFDWNTNALRVIDHHRDRVDRIEVKATRGHSGGDQVLAQMFVDVIRQRTPSRASLRDGLLSAAMCMAARRSNHSQTFEPIHLPDEPAPTVRAARLRVET